MKGGIDVVGRSFFDPDHYPVPQWTCDEDGSLARAVDVSLREFEAVAREACTAEYMHDHDVWMHEERSRMLVPVSDQVAREAAYAANSAAAWMELESGTAGARGAVGLVLLPTTFQPSSKRRKAVWKVEPNEAQAAALKAAGAVPCGADQARLAKLRRAVGSASLMLSAVRAGHRPHEARMVTLTHRPGSVWSSKQMPAFMQRMHNWHRDHDIKAEYVWIAEDQDGTRRIDGKARHAIHYHIVFWVPPGTPNFPKPDKAGWWPHGSTNVKAARKATAYLISYLKKSKTKHFEYFPKGARAYGVGGLDHSMRRARRWLGLPGFVRGNGDPSANWRRDTSGRGGWLAPDGTHWPSEFRRVHIAGLPAMQRMHIHPRAFEADGVYSTYPRIGS